MIVVSTCMGTKTGNRNWHTFNAANLPVYVSQSIMGTIVNKQVTKLIKGTFSCCTTNKCCQTFQISVQEQHKIQVSLL